MYMYTHIYTVCVYIYCICIKSLFVCLFFLFPFILYLHVFFILFHSVHLSVGLCGVDGSLDGSPADFNCETCILWLVEKRNRLRKDTGVQAISAIIITELGTFDTCSVVHLIFLDLETTPPTFDISYSTHAQLAIIYRRRLQGLFLFHLSSLVILALYVCRLLLLFRLLLPLPFQPLLPGGTITSCKWSPHLLLFYFSRESSARRGMFRTQMALEPAHTVAPLFLVSRKLLFTFIPSSRSGLITRTIVPMLAWVSIL